jgi:hypothetical protein
MVGMVMIELLRSKTESLTARCFINRVFPDLHAALHAYSSELLQHFLTAVEPKYCKEFHVVFSGRLVQAALGEEGQLILRNPTLIPIQIVGMLIGGIIGVNIPRRDGMSAAYSWAFINFAFMNLTSIIGHSLGTPGSSLWSFGISLDVSFTGASCICLILAALNSRKLVQSSPAAIRAIAPVCIVAVLVNSYTINLPFVSEMMYLGNLLVASLFLLWHYTTSYWREPNFISYLAFAGGGAILALSAIVFEHRLCDITTGAYTSVPAVFLGCCAMFLSVFLFSFNLEAQKDKKKGE